MVAFLQETLRTDTRSRILDAAFGAVATHGLSRFTVDDVARAAGLSRQSVYRYFDSRDALIVALVDREEERFLEGARAAYAAREGLQDAMAAAIAFCLGAAREHPLLDRLLASEPQVLLPYLTTRGGSVVARARAVVEQLAAERPDVDHRLVPRAADAVARAIISYVITPPDDDPGDVARELAAVMTRGLQRKNLKEDRR